VKDYSEGRFSSGSVGLIIKPFTRGVIVNSLE
jgi:hypothetical protein